MARSTSTHETIRCLCGVEDEMVVTYSQSIDNLRPEVAAVVAPPGWTSHTVGTKTVWRCADCTRRLSDAKGTVRPAR